MKTEEVIKEDIRKIGLHRNEALKRLGQIVVDQNIRRSQIGIDITKEMLELRENVKSYNHDIELLEWVLTDNPSVGDL